MCCGERNLPILTQCKDQLIKMICEECIGGNSIKHTTTQSVLRNFSISRNMDRVCLSCCVFFYLSV